MDSKLIRLKMRTHLDASERVFDDLFEFGELELPALRSIRRLVQKGKHELVEHVQVELVLNLSKF